MKRGIYKSEKDVHTTIRLSPGTWEQARSIVATAIKEGIMIQGTKNPVLVKQSHVLLLAVELGLPGVLEELRKMQVDSA